MYAALTIAKYVINKCVEDKCPISNMQLQKILYYLQREFLQHETILFPEDIEAWKIGPVVPDVYYHFYGFGSMPINMGYDRKIKQNDTDIINPIIESKRILKPWDLVSDVHSPEKAWNVIYKNGLGNHQIIPKKLIKNQG